MLTDLKIKSLKPCNRPYMVRDDRGLYLEVHPTGARYWRIRIWEKGKEIRRSLGVYPLISLREARERRDQIKVQIAHGYNPLKKRAGQTFREIAMDWFDRKVVPSCSKSHSDRTMSRMNRFLFPSLGDTPINEITAPDLLEVLRLIEASGSLETAHRVLQICGSVFRYAIATGNGEGVRDLSADLRGALQSPPVQHYPTITEPAEIGGLLRAIDGMEKSPIVRWALLMQILTLTRPGELRQMEWGEVNLRTAEWRIPPHRMKMRRLHLVPLSRQAVGILEELKPVTGHGRFVFPSSRTYAKGDRPMSDGTMAAALRRLGFSQGEITPHGFRAMAATTLNELGWPSEAIERQLAHVERSVVRAAYVHAEHLDVRRKMMQSWADWLDEAKQIR